MKTTRSIRFRIVFGLALIMVLSVGLSIYLTTVNQRDNLLDASQRTLAINNEMLNATIRNIMLSGEAPIANQTIDDFRAITGFLEFEVYRTDGTTAFNDYRTLDFVNEFQDRVMFDPTPRQERRILESEGFERVLRHKSPVIIRNEDTREMEYLFPILNYADCRACHGTEQFVRGVSHFRISLGGIYEQVNRAGTLMTVYFVSVGLVLFAWILLLMRRTVVRPVLKIGEAVNVAATGDLDVRVELDSDDELGMLGHQVNHMISGLRERRDLELRNRVVETRLQENRKYLDNIKEGLLLLDRDRRISDQYSVFLTRLFHREGIAGLTLPEFLYPDAERDADRRRELETFLEMLYTNTTAAMDMILSINPLDEAELSVGSGETIVIRADFLRIYDRDELANVMVIFEDLTDINRTRHELEEQRSRREAELEQIATVLKAGPQVFEGFLDEAELAFSELGTHLADLGRPDYVARAFRSIHSVKGTARYLDFPRVEELCQGLEELLAEIRDGRRLPDDAVESAAADIIRRLDAEVAAVRRLIDRFRDFAGGGRLPASPLEVFTDRLTGMVRDIAADLEKSVDFALESDLADIPRLAELQPSIVHLIRNALDHGIEDEYERLAAGKDSAARLVLRFRKADRQLVVEVEDDGRGLDLEALEKRGLETGLLKPGNHLPSQIVNMLFRPGFSARQEANDISGRGVGLDAVKEDVRAMKGQINVRTAAGKGSAFVLQIPLGEDSE